MKLPKNCPDPENYVAADGTFMHLLYAVALVQSMDPRQRAEVKPRLLAALGAEVSAD